MKSFNSDEHVKEWMNENGGIDGLRRALARGAFSGQNKSLASAWLDLHDRKTAEETAELERSLLERSAKAAENSAQSASQSARWAMWATVVAVVALLVSVFHS